ncbi:MAG: hypothetical protein ACKV2Q_36550 [Planctomycetaceae bacterium]
MSVKQVQSKMYEINAIADAAERMSAYAAYAHEVFSWIEANPNESTVGTIAGIMTTIVLG